MKLKNLIIFVLVGVGVTYGGVKGVIYYKTKQQLDRMVAAAAPFADIEYGSIGSDLQGRIMINDLVVYPRGVNDAVKAEQLQIITPGLEFLLTGADSLKSGELPRRMGVALVGARLNLTGRLVEAMEQAEAAQLGQQPVDGLACSLSGNFITAQYRELGLDELVFDTEVSFKRGVSAGDVIIGVHYALAGLEEAEVSVTLSGLGNSVMGIALASPQLKSVTVNYRPNAGFSRKTLADCAARQGVDVQTYLDQLFAQNDEQYLQDLGFVPGPGIRAAMKEMMQHPGELKVFAQPTSTLDMKTVHLYKPEDWPDLFGLVVKVNGKDVSDLSFSMPDPDPAQGDEQAAALGLPGLAFISPGSPAEQTQDRQQVQQRPADTSPQRSAGTPRYRVVPRSDVPQLVGKDVRIYTVDGKRRSGRVLNVKNGVISLEMRMHGGTLSTRVPVSTAGKIEVLDRG
jgi:hypothetical protein